MDEELLRVDGLTVHYPIRDGLFSKVKRVVHAVDDISFHVGRGETVGLVGESGSGKSTTGLAVLRRVEPTAGSIHFNGQDITTMRGERLRRLRRDLQMIFQDPYASLNPRMKIREIVGEPLVVHGIVRDKVALRQRVDELLDLCGLPSDAADRYPHAFSGGQRQRVAISRALALEPALIVADEPVSALDVSIQAQVVNLMKDLQRKLRVSYLFIAHDLAVVRHISHRIVIMYAGKIAEIAEAQSIYDNALHPYTHALLSAVPIPDPAVEKQRERIILAGDVPDPIEPPTGCRFHGRCQHAQPRCTVEVPLLRPVDQHLVACHFAEEIRDRGQPRSVKAAAPEV